MRPDYRVALALAAATALAGCSPDADVLARVGNRAIRRDDFTAIAEQLAHRYPGPPDSAKVQLLTDMVDRELLVEAALRQGLHRDTVFLDLGRQLEEQMVRQRYYDQLGATQVAVSEDEVEQLHRWRAEERWVRIVYALSEPAARSALAQIRRGDDFAAVADRFNMAGQIPAGGDLGYVRPGMLPLPLDEVVRTAPLGEVLGPIEVVGQGWFLAKVQESRRAEPIPLEAERGTLATLLRQRKQRQVLLRELRRLREAYHVRVLRGAGQELIARVLPYALKGEDPPALTPGESAVAAVAYDGGPYTLGEAFADLRAGQVQRPDFNVLATVEHWLESRALERVTLLEARTRLLQEDPDVRRAVRQRLDDFLLQSYLATEISDRATVTQDDVREAFAHAGIPPTRLERARFLAVALRDSALAAQLAATAGQAGGLREAVAAAALGVPVRAETVTFPTETPWEALEQPLMATEVGGYTPAVEGPMGWVVAQLLEKRVAPVSFESLPPGTLAMLTSQARDIKRARMLTALTDSLRHAIPTAVYRARLARVPWPEGPPPIQG